MRLEVKLLSFLVDFWYFTFSVRSAICQSAFLKSAICQQCSGTNMLTVGRWGGIRSKLIVTNRKKMELEREGRFNEKG